MPSNRSRNWCSGCKGASGPRPCRALRCDPVLCWRPCALSAVCRRSAHTSARACSRARLWTSARFSDPLVARWRGVGLHPQQGSLGGRLRLLFVPQRHAPDPCTHHRAGDYRDQLLCSHAAASKAGSRTAHEALTGAGLNYRFRRKKSACPDSSGAFGTRGAAGRSAVAAEPFVCESEAAEGNKSDDGADHFLHGVSRSRGRTYRSLQLMTGG